MMVHLRSDEAACLPYQTVVARLRTSPHTGLPHAEATRRRRVHGYNEFDISEDEPLWKKYLGQVSQVLLGFKPFFFQLDYFGWTYEYTMGCIGILRGKQ